MMRPSRFVIRPFILIMALALNLNPAPPAWSDTRPVPPDELDAFCRRADWIVHGRVMTRADFRDDSGHIWTIYKIELTETLKSPAAQSPATLEIRQLGGRFGNQRQIATDSPHFRQGEELILFTRDYGQGWQSAAEGARGCLRVRAVKTTDRSGKEKIRKIVPSAQRVQTGLPLINLDQLKARLRVSIEHGSKVEGKGGQS